MVRYEALRTDNLCEVLGGLRLNPEHIPLCQLTSCEDSDDTVDD